jgi:hypothetical protein
VSVAKIIWRLNSSEFLPEFYTKKAINFQIAR